MPSDYRQMMQERLDGLLDLDQAAELEAYLRQDEAAAEEQAQLEQVHDVLTRPPLERAPQRMALTIMARLAQHIEAQSEIQALPEELQQALLVSWSLVSVTMMPMLVSASYMVLNTQASPAVLEEATNRVIAMMVIMIDSMVVILEEIERLIREDPQMAPVALSLIPIAMLGILDYVQEKTEEHALMVN